MPAPLPPYAIPAPAFRFRHLATLAGRAPIGGAREVALACYLAARLVADAADGQLSLADGDRATRAGGAKAWLSSLAIPASVRGPLGRCLELSAAGSAAQLAREVRTLAEAATPFLTSAARGELAGLAARVAG